MFRLAAVALISFPAAAQDWRDAALSEIAADDLVVEAMFPQDRSLWVSVRPDGTNRDGLAEYFCVLTSMAGRPAGEFVVVRVLEAYKLANDEMETIGRAECR